MQRKKIDVYNPYKLVNIKSVFFNVAYIHRPGHIVTSHYSLQMQYETNKIVQEKKNRRPSDDSNHYRRNLTAPGTGDDWERCLMYNVNWTHVLINNSVSPNAPTMPCKDGWEFEFNDIPYPTIVSEVRLLHQTLLKYFLL